jgi:hypothetical protein
MFPFNNNLATVTLPDPRTRRTRHTESDYAAEIFRVAIVVVVVVVVVVETDTKFKQR